MELIWLLANLATTVVVAGKRLEHVQVNYTILEPLSNNVDALIDPWLRPIRIHVHEVDYSLALDSAHSNLFRQQVAHVVARASNLLKVFPVSGPLFLSHDLTHLCQTPLNGNPNKCQERWDINPKENCGVDGDFAIPAEHYKDFLLCSPDGCVVDIPGGAGLADTDVVVYIGVNSIQYCNVDNSGILAFTKICKRDQFGRPIASFINVCTSEVTTAGKLKLRETLFHEMLHALGLVGLSLHLFLDSCRIRGGELDCQFADVDALSSVSPFPTEVLQDRSTSNGKRFEMVRTNTHSAWAHHVNCHHYQFSHRGAAWVTFIAEDSYDDIVGDHWALQSMMGSIMSPLLREPYMQVLDNLTIAAFKDMGWYSVNDSLVEPYLWGRNSGCHFSEFSYCTNVTEAASDDRFFCATRGSSGCHYLHLHKGTCESIQPSNPCQYYKPTEACFIDTEKQKSSIEEFCTNCRCFVSTLKQAICLERRCVDGMLEIGIDGDWINCPYNETIEIKTVNMSLRCPPANVLCTERDLRLPELLDSGSVREGTTSQPAEQDLAAQTTISTATVESSSVQGAGTECGISCAHLLQLSLVLLFSSFLWIGSAP